MAASRTRLVISGFACPESSWRTFLADRPEQKVLPLAQVVGQTRTGDPRVWGKYVAEQIERENPSSIVCHDIGVTTTFLALFRLASKGKIPPGLSVTSFNGSLRGFDVFRARHPFKMQLASWSAVREAVPQSGGHVDPALEGLFPYIRQFYRFVILSSLQFKALNLVGKARPKLPELGCKLQLIASLNDPFIPPPILEILIQDIPWTKVHRINYGHFPYSLPGEGMRKLVSEFELPGPRS